MKAVALLAIGALVPGVARAQATSYHVTSRYNVGGEGGWDYLTPDAAGHRLFLSRSTHVMVLSLDSGTVVGDIANTPGVHGIALAQDLGRGFISNGRDSSVTIFDLRTLAPIGNVKTGGRNPDAIAYDAFSRRVFAMNGASGTATAIDAATGTVAGMVTLGGKLEMVVPDGRGRVFVNVEDSSQIGVFDARTLAVQAKWPIAPCEEPSGLAMDRANDLLFAVCGNGLMAVVDARSGRVVTTLPICRGTDGAAFDPGPMLAFASCGDGNLTIVHEAARDRFSVAATVPTQRGARTITLDEATHRVYLPTAEYGPAPEPTAAQPRRRPSLVPGTFTVLVVEP